MLVVIDDRERALYEALTDMQFPCERRRLDSGDVHIYVDDAGESVHVVIERKTRADLQASLKDGRFHEQRARMVRSFGAERVCYIVEGGTDWASMASRAEIGLVFRDRVPTLWTADVRETAVLVAALTKSDIEHRTAPPSDPFMCKTAKAEHADPWRALASMLRCVHGVSSRRATCIARKYGSVIELSRVIDRDPDAAKLDIGDVRDGVGGKRLGPALASRVVAAMGGSLVAKDEDAAV